MSRTVSSKPTKSGRLWLNISSRIIVGFIMLFAVVGFFLNVAELALVWYSFAPARSSVITVASTISHALVTADSGLTRVNDRVQNARQTLSQVNDQAAALGDRIQANSPVVTKLSQLIDNNLAPQIENVQTTAGSIHDAVVNVNSALNALNRFPDVSVPTLNNALGSVSDRAQEAETAVQDLRVTLADLKAGVATKAKTSVTQLTSRIDNGLVRIQAIVNKYQATVKHTQVRLTTARDNILLLINLLAVSLTLLLLIVGVGLVLLIFVCLQYVRTGHFPSLRVSIASGSVSKQVAIHDNGTQTKAVQAEDSYSSQIPAEEKESLTSAESPTLEKTADSATEGSA